jgi:hypothetical protein
VLSALALATALLGSARAGDAAVSVASPLASKAGGGVARPGHSGGVRGSWPALPMRVEGMGATLAMMSARPARRGKPSIHALGGLR